MESVFKGPRLMEFHIEFAKTCILNNRLWLRFIESPEKKIAATYDFALEGRVFGYQGGMDPEWKSYALGSVLYYLATEEAASKGLTQYDFGGGDEEYKRRWTTMYRRLMHLRVFNKTVRSRIARGYRFASTYDLARSYQDARNFFIKKS
jgi:CelD/BcsL family acetyltransferase involved in cellulose biosynthesis